MNFRQISHFLEVVKTQNFAKAAKNLQIGQSALSQSIAKLEGSLGTSLFERGRFGAFLTHDGQRLLPHATLMNAERQLAIQEFSSLKNKMQGRLAIGIGRGLAGRFLSKVITEFQAQYPDVLLTVIEGLSSELFKGLLDGTLDLAVSAPPSDLAIDPELEISHLFSEKEELVFNTQDFSTTGRVIDIKDLAEFLWLVTPYGNGRVRQIQTYFLEKGLAAPQNFLRTNSTEVLRSYLETQPCAAIVFKGMSWPGHIEKHIIHMDIPELCHERSVVLTRSKRSSRKDYAKKLKDIFKELAPS